MRKTNGKPSLNHIHSSRKIKQKTDEVSGTIFKAAEVIIIAFLNGCFMFVPYPWLKGNIMAL